MTKYSTHAIRQMQQRGIRATITETILEYSNKKVHVGNGCIAYSIDRKQLETLKKLGTLDAQLVEKIDNVCLVVGPDNKVVTAMHLEDGKKGRLYRVPSRRGHHRDKHKR